MLAQFAALMGDELPSADVVIMGHVLHDWDPPAAARPGGQGVSRGGPGRMLLVYDRMLDDEPRHVENLVIGLDMLLVTDGGSEYPVRELHSNAEAAGLPRSLPSHSATTTPW